MAARIATNFDIPDALWRVLRECEVNCVGGCCGRAAFDFDPQVIRHCFLVSPGELLPVARQHLDQLIAALEVICGPVDTLMIKDEWTGAEAASWFSDFRRVFDAVAGSLT